MRQVTLIRGYVLRKLRDMKVFISCLPEREDDALKALDGSEGTKTAARIADYILEQLGHVPPANPPEGTSPTVRAARQAIGNPRK